MYMTSHYVDYMKKNLILNEVEISQVCYSKVVTHAMAYYIADLPMWFS